jgi:hypothetical protein
VFDTPRSYVYLGGFRPHPQLLFVKVGKADNLVSRSKAYATHLPGGLSFLYAAEVVNSDVAYVKEAHLLVTIAEIEGCTSVGGEWFRVAVDALPKLVEELRKLDPDAFQVKLGKPKSFTSSPKARRVKSVRDRAEQRKDWRSAAEDLPEGVAGLHSGRHFG